jgi:integrase
MDTKGIQDYLFSPKDAHQERCANALTHRREKQKKNPVSTDRTIRDYYDTASYRRAITRACRKAGVPAWTPHRLRHNSATQIRRDYGLEAAQIILGHSKADVTQLYAERDETKALRVIQEIG